MRMMSFMAMRKVYEYIHEEEEEHAYPSDYILDGALLETMIELFSILDYHHN